MDDCIIQFRHPVCQIFSLADSAQTHRIAYGRMDTPYGKRDPISYEDTSYVSPPDIHLPFQLFLLMFSSIRNHYSASSFLLCCHIHLLAPQFEDQLEYWSHYSSLPFSSKSYSIPLYFIPPVVIVNDVVRYTPTAESTSDPRPDLALTGPNYGPVVCHEISILREEKIYMIE